MATSSSSKDGRRSRRMASPGRARGTAAAADEACFEGVHVSAGGPAPALTVLGGESIVAIDSTAVRLEEGAEVHGP
jgi:hypothetical protein